MPTIYDATLPPNLFVYGAVVGQSYTTMAQQAADLFSAIDAEMKEKPGAYHNTLKSELTDNVVNATNKAFNFLWGENLSTDYPLHEFSDASIGGNDAINPYWAFNLDDDLVPETSMASSAQYPYFAGMGRVYREMYDNNQQIMWITFGVPRYMGLLEFYHDAADKDTTELMNTGSVNLSQRLLTLISKGAGLILSVPFLPFKVLAMAINVVNGKIITKYCEFEEDMPLYFKLVNTMLSQCGTAMGIYPNQVDHVSGNMGDTSGANKAKNAILKSYAADMFGYDGPDILKILKKRGRMARGSDTSKEDVDNFLKKLMAKSKREVEDVIPAEPIQGESAADTAKRAIKTIYRYYDKAIGIIGKDFITTFADTATDNLAFIGIRVEKSVDASESISNSVGASQLAGMLNGKVQEAREKQFNMAGGKITGGVLGDVVSGAMDMVKSLSSAIGSQALEAIYMGNGFFDLPEVWQSSSFSKSHSFKMVLRTPYGNDLSIFQSLYIPLFMIMAGGIPRGIGKNMYTSPMYCQCYCKGMYFVPYGMIGDVSITRGSAEFGWNYHQLPTVVEVSFSVKDLTPAMFLSVDDFEPLNPLQSLLASNNNMTEYINTLSGVGLKERTYMLAKLRLKTEQLIRTYANVKMNPLMWGNSMGNTRLVKGLARLSPWGGWGLSTK